MKSQFASSLSAIAASAMFVAAVSSSASAADYTWDTVSDGAAITAGSGAWSTTGTNWNNGSVSVVWSQTSATVASHNAIFAGADGAYTVTLSGTTNAQSVTFNNSGYTLTAGTLTLKPTTTTSGSITVAAGKTATINSNIAYTNNQRAGITVNSGGTLNLGGGASNSQYNFEGAGTVNMTAGTYTANVGKSNVATFNQSGGTFNIQPNGTNSGYNIGVTAGQSVSYTMSGSAVINFNAQGTGTSSTGTNSFFAIGRASGAASNTNTFNVTGAANLNIGTTVPRSGELQIAASADSTGTLNVSGGAVTVGTGTAPNKIYFFKAGSGAGYTANMTQSGGTVTANGIQFGGTAGTYDPASSANLTLTGGVLYVGAEDITKGSGAGDLPTNIKLQGGVIGASDNWSSSLDMKLGTTSGGPIFQAATSGTVSKNITLSGVLSDDASVNGKLTKTGAGTLTLSGSNTYTGATTVNAGTLALGASNVLPDASAISIGAATLNASTYSDTAGTLAVTGSATINLGTGAALAFADSSAIDWSAGTLFLDGTFVSGASLRFGTTNGGLTSTQLSKISATGNPTLALNNDGFLVVEAAAPPTLASSDIVDNKDGGPIASGTEVTYTLTFSQAMNAATISAEDFVNGGGATYTVGAVTQVSDTVFTVKVTPTSAGALILQIPTTANITNAIGTALVCDPAINDDTTITVNTSSAPTLASADIVDDKGGQPVSVNMLVTYTLTFSEDIDAATVTSDDFANAGSATLTIGTITETSPGVFTVQVTPTGVGTLQFGIKANAVIRASASSNVMNTISAIVDNTTLTVGSDLTWDTVTGDGGGVITGGSGEWNVGGNSFWNNILGNVPWSQTSISDASNAAIFAGDDGTANQYAVTLGGVIAADSVTFNSSGYQITSGTLALRPTTSTNGGITVAAGKTATINSPISYSSNARAEITADSGATLNLGGGASNSQYRFQGAGTVNMTAGTYTANVGSMNTATFNHSGGTYTMNLPTAGDGHYIGYAAGRSVSYTMSGSAIINANASGTTSNNSFLAIGRNAGNVAYSNTLNVQAAANLNVGNAAGMAGELLIAADNISNGMLNVTGGAVTVGTGKTENKIYFFKAGSGAGYAANMTQSGGTVTANGIQFGGASGTYSATSEANFTLSGSSSVLYVGAQGITRGSGAGDLPVAIRLQSGVIGASDSWSSSLDMKLGSGPVFQAATSGTAPTAKNITLSGSLSNDASVDGKLTKTGAGTLTLSGSNSFTGATTVNAGTLALGDADALSASSSLTMANGTTLSLNTPSTVKALTFSNAGTLNFDLSGAATTLLTVSNVDGVTNSGAAGSVTINITGAAPASGTYTLIDYDGTPQGAGYTAYTLGTTPAGKIYTLTNDIATGAVKLDVQSILTWTGAQTNEWSTNVIAGLKNWTFDGSAADYSNGVPVLFDNTATNKTVEITGADASPLSVLVSSGTYTLQATGTNRLASSGTVTVSSGATLKLGSSNVLPDGGGTGNLLVNGTLDLNGNSDTINGLTGSGSVDNAAATTTSTLTLGSITGGVFSGSIKNTGGTLALAKTGATDVILSGSNSYSGATTVNQNRLFISGTNALSPSTAVTVNNGAALIFNTTGTYAQSITLNSGANMAQRQSVTLSNVTLPGSGSVIFNNDGVATQTFSLGNAQTLTGALTVQVGGGSGSAGAVTLGGILSGSGGSLVKTGTGTLILRGANTFGGGVAIKNGTLESQATQTTLGTGTVTMGGAGSAGATFLTGQNNSNTFVINAPESGDIVIGANGAGSGFTLSGGVNLNGNLTLQTFNNTVPVPPATTKATVNLTGGVTGAGNLLLNNLGLAANIFNISGSSVNHTGTITLQGTATGTTTISSAIGSNVTGITQNSASSVLVLSGSNTYACDLTVSAGAVTISDNSNTANDGSTVDIASGGTLNLTYAGTDTVGKLIVNGSEKAAGEYGAVGSASPVIGIPEITGTGTVTVGAPDIVVELDGTEIIAGGSADFGSVEVNASKLLTFTIRNAGDQALNLNGTPLVDILGDADFTVTADPASTVGAGSSTTFTVQFTPAEEGGRYATITIASNDAAEPSYSIELSGTGEVAADPYSSWSGGAAFDADANGDGVSNGLAWILGAADANADARSLLPTATVSGTNLVYTFKRAQASIIASVALTVEVGTTLSDWSSTYSVGADTAGSTSGVTITKDSPSAGTDTVTVTIPRGADTKKFARLKAVQTP